MLKRRLFGIVASFALVTACVESPTQPVDVDLLTAAADANPVIGSASGSGHAPCAAVAPFFVCQTQNPDGALRTFTFTAEMRADGSVTGRTQVKNRENGVHAQGEILCLRFTSDNRAWMVARATHVIGGGAPVGSTFGFAVEDNGEGNGSAPDRMTNLFPGDGAAICLGGNDGFLNFIQDNFSYDVVRGNVQVRAP